MSKQAQLFVVAVLAVGATLVAAAAPAQTEETQVRRWAAASCRSGG